MAKKSSPYFSDFVTMAQCSCQAADFLQEVLRDFDPETLPDAWKKMHEIEHAEDQIKHDIMHKLVKEFVTPIDREDILQLANELDNVTDKIDDILIRMYMYNVKTVHPAAFPLAEVIQNCCKALHTAMQEFSNFQKSSTLMTYIIEVNNMEEKGDSLYIDAVRELYRAGGDPLEITTWRDLFEEFEECCDACEDVADMMEMIILKNT